MSTTALFIDLLITGIQVAIWLVLIVFSLFGFDWLSVNRLQEYETAIAVLLLPIVYPIGVFIDNLADDILSPWRKKIQKKYVPDQTQSVMKLLVTMKDDKLSSYFDYVRIRIRISRSSALNFSLITITSLIFTLAKLRGVLGDSLWKVVIFEFVVGAIFTGLAILSWFRITETFYKKLDYGLRIISGKTYTDKGKQENLEEIIT